MTRSTNLALSAALVLFIPFLIAQSLQLIPSLWNTTVPAPMVLIVSTLIAIATIAGVFHRGGMTGLRPLWIVALSVASSLSIFVAFGATSEHAGSWKATVALVICTVGSLTLLWLGKQAFRDRELLFFWGFAAVAAPFVTIGVAGLPPAVPLVLCIVFISLWRERRIARAAFYAELGI